MKTKAESHLSPLFIISLLILIPSFVFGAGLAAIKEQSFHQDAGANIVVYSTLTVSGPSVKIETANRTFTIDSQKLAGKIDVISALPANITTERELEPVRKAVKEYRDFSIRFPKSAPVLAQNITTLDAYIKAFEGGKARYNGEWWPKEDVLAHIRTEAWAKNVEDAEVKRRAEEKLAFEKSQKAKGLGKYNGEWIPLEEARRLAARDQAAFEKDADAVKKTERKLAHEQRIKEEKQQIIEEEQRIIDSKLAGKQWSEAKQRIIEAKQRIKEEELVEKRRINEEKLAEEQRSKEEMLAEKEAYAKIQKGKGLEEYEGEWLTHEKILELEKHKDYLKENAYFLRGEVRQVTREGIIVFSHYGNERMPNYNSRPPHRPELRWITGDFLVVGHPEQDGKVDNDWFDVDAVPDGIFEYTTVLGASKRIRKFRVVDSYY